MTRAGPVCARPGSQTNCPGFNCLAAVRSGRPFNLTCSAPALPDNSSTATTDAIDLCFIVDGCSKTAAKSAGETRERERGGMCRPPRPPANLEDAFAHLNMLGGA